MKIRQRNVMMDKIPIIVGGFYRSGTSLVRRLLDSHSNIHCGPEIKFFKDLDCDYINDPLGHVRFFSTLPSLGLTREDILALFGPAFVQAHERAAAKAGKNRWADKNPENVIYLEDWKTLLPQGFLFVHVVRNPLDALASLKSIGFEKTIPRPFSARVALLKTFLDAGRNYAEANPTTSRTVHYEDLVRDPEKTLTHLFEWLDERPELNVLDNFYRPERGDGIEDPKVKKTRTIHSKSVGRGSTELTRHELQIVEQVMNSPVQHASSTPTRSSRLWRLLRIIR